MVLLNKFRKFRIVCQKNNLYTIQYTYFGIFWTNLIYEHMFHYTAQRHVDDLKEGIR